MVKFQPRTGQTPSKATLAKLSGATYKAGDLSSRHTVAPDGGAIADYPKGWRFLPADMVMPPDSLTGDGSWQPNMVNPDFAPYTLHEIMKDQTHVDSNRNSAIKVTSFGLRVVKAMKDLHNSNGNNPKAQEVIADAYHHLVIAPQIKAQKEAIARKEEEERQAIATLKMRVQELTKKPVSEPTAPAITTSTTSYLPLAVVGIVIVVILIILRRRA